jgi:Domain of unknown function (DUF5076)
MPANELTPPPRAYALTSEELLRVWFANQRLNVIACRFESAAYVGLMLADLGGHAARAFADQKITPFFKGMTAIRAAFNTAAAESARDPEGPGSQTDSKGVYASTPEQKFRQLSVPLAILADPEAGEVIRIWRCVDKLEMALMPIWDGPDNWGILINDLCRLLAAPHQAAGITAADIRTWVLKEWEHPTDRGTIDRLRRN